MSTFYGIIVYEIKENGNLLVGCYTNNGLKIKNGYEIDPEFLRKRPNDNAGLEGVYHCRYAEIDNSEVIVCKVAITKIEEVYEFKWTLNNDTIWIGLGLMAGSKHISVAYTDPKQ